MGNFAHFKSMVAGGKLVVISSSCFRAHRHLATEARVFQKPVEAVEALLAWSTVTVPAVPQRWLPLLRAHHLPGGPLWIRILACLLHYPGLLVNPLSSIGCRSSSRNRCRASSLRREDTHADTNKPSLPWVRLNLDLHHGANHLRNDRVLSSVFILEVPHHHHQSGTTAQLCSTSGHACQLLKTVPLRIIMDLNAPGAQFVVLWLTMTL